MKEEGKVMNIKVFIAMAVALAITLAISVVVNTVNITTDEDGTVTTNEVITVENVTNILSSVSNVIEDVVE